MLRSKRLAACVLLAFMLASILTQPAAAIAFTPATMLEPAEVVTSESAPASDVAPAETPASRVVTEVYRSAGFSGTVIGCLENGTVIKVLSSSGKFYRIQCFEIKGYIAKAQVAQNEKGEYYVNIDPACKSTKTLPTLSASEALTLRNLIRSTARKYLGVPYVWGGETPKGFDCSGFTQYVFRKQGYDIHRTALQQMQDGLIIAKEDLQCGDLIFFTKTGQSDSYASHVGIYIGNGKMIHSGNSGVAVVNFGDSYYQNHFLCARRVIITDVEMETLAPTTGLTQNINSSFWRENTQTETDGLGSFLP